jgi:hypothetical protein
MAYTIYTRENLMKLAAYLAVLSVASFSSAIADKPQFPAAQPAAAAQSTAPNAPVATGATDAPATAKLAAAESTAPSKVDKSELVNVAVTGGRPRERPSYSRVS